ncbi:hypothetical protein J2736_006726 [Paenibacillus qinlingensis]|uniref:Uncharacterized protein n=2 Tax=Paenibacillus qinlingensis TaxID=1837343 RepID=A0ABU1P7A7_9BACL|nr:hypothetical protein [Paenibacillus qinlingensis]
MIGCIEKNNLMDRIIKGAELIELEKDPAIKRRYIDVYESLIHELERLKSA